jgi:hypothetical protein
MKDQPMIRSKGGIALAAAAVIAVTAALSIPADARIKKKKQYRFDPRIDTTLPRRGRSLDGVVLGWDRTCGHSVFVYDEMGVPMGPYCR